MSHAADALAYAEDVIAGRVPAGEHVRQACERHVRDLSRQRAEGFPFFFYANRGEAACRFAEEMPHVKGRWGLTGEKLRLERWQKLILVSLFGWVRDEPARCRRCRAEVELDAAGRVLQHGSCAGAGLDAHYPRRFRIAYIEVPRKNGKALALDTPLPTPQGWSSMGSIRVGDQLFDETGEQCRVVAVGPVQEGRPCYRVAFSDGSSVVADAEHEWYTEARRTGLPRTGLGPKASWPDRHIRTTAQICDTLALSSAPGRPEWNHRVPCAGPLVTDRGDLPCPPYVLGVWLGDGSNGQAAFTAAYADHFIVEEVRREGVAAVERKSSNQNSGVYSLSPRGGDRSCGAALRALGLLGGSKYVPDAYLRAPEQQRMALLQGLMDTDGTASKAGQCVYTTTSRRLLAGVVELLRSLGYKPMVREGRAMLNGKDCGEKFDAQFWAFSDRPVFRLPRKIARLKPPRAGDGRPRSQHRQIVGVSAVPSVPVRCIQVDSPSSLFLAGESMIPTHNSSLAAAVGNYMFVADAEHGAEVYCGATTEAQAYEVYRPAWEMVDRSPDLRSGLGIDQGGTKKNPGPMYCLSTSSRFAPVIGKPGDGASPHCAIVDEYHEHASDELYDTMLTGMGSREQPLMFVITTAGSDIAGPCYALRTDVVRMLEGGSVNEELFGVVYTVDQGDDWTAESSLVKANPNFGVSVSADFLRMQVRDAVSSSRKQNIIKTKHLNVWTTARTAWMNMEAWHRQGDAPPLAEWGGAPCWGGLDLASKVDIAAKVLLFERDGHYYAYATSYLPEKRAEEPDKQHYQGWVHDGHLKATEGNIIDHRVIAEDLEADAKRHGFIALGCDPYSAPQLQVRLQDSGLLVVDVGMTVAYLSEPMKWIEARVIEGRLHHDGNPCTAWQIGNIVARTDANDNVFPRKEREENKIDAGVALIIAMNRALAQAAPARSVYEERGVLFV